MSKGEQTRTDIVERALVLASDVGLEAVTLGVLAERSGRSKSGLFAHFKSKEALQLAVLEKVIANFAAEVVQPVFQLPRGEARVRALFERYLAWIYGTDRRGRCLFMSLAQEYDDRPGAIRERLASSQRDWFDAIARVAQGAIATGHFRANLDTQQFAYEFVGIAMAFQHTYKLLADAHADDKAQTAFTALLERSSADIRAVPSASSV